MKSNSYSISPIFTVATIAIVLAGRISLAGKRSGEKQRLELSGYGTAVEIVDGDTTVLYEGANLAGQSAGAECALGSELKPWFAR